MKLINIDEVSKTKRKLTLQIEPADLSEEKEEAYEELSKEAALPGFRKGKVPRKFLELRFDKTIRKEAFEDAINKALNDVSKEKEIRIIGKPTFEPSDFSDLVEKVSEEPVEVGVTVEVIPQFDLPQYTGLNLPIDFKNDEDSVVEKILGMNLQRSAFFMAVDNRPTREGDHVVVQCTTTRAGAEVPGLSAPRLMINDLGKGGFPAEFEKGLINVDKGASFEFDFSIEQGYPLFLEDGDNSCHTRCKILSISEKDLPDLDDDFAKDHGYDSLAAYREHLREEVKKSEDRILTNQKRNAVQDYLIDKTEVAVPSSLVQSDYMIIKYRRQMEARQRGDTDPMIPSDEEEVETMFQAEEETKRRLILHKIAEKESITITEDEYFDNMEVIARSRGEKNLDRFLAQIEKDGLESVYNEQFLFGKVIKWLVENNEFEISEPESPEAGS